MLHAPIFYPNFLYFDTERNDLLILTLLCPIILLKEKDDIVEGERLTEGPTRLCTPR